MNMDTAQWQYPGDTMSKIALKAKKDGVSTDRNVRLNQSHGWKSYDSYDFLQILYHVAIIRPRKERLEY